MKKGLVAIITILFALYGNMAKAEKVIAWEVQLGYNIGATLPSPFPAEIREVKGYTPLFNPSIGVMLSTTNSAWNLVSGLRLGRKGMETKARVKSYSTELHGDDGENVKGVWTGDVSTCYDAIGISMPVVATYTIKRWKIAGGVYGEYLIAKHFGGEVYDGYFRQGDPTGVKAVYENGAKQEYAFDEKIRNLQWGVEIGVAYPIGSNWTINLDATYCLSNIFEKDFTTISFKMQPMFVNFAVGYRF